MINPGIAPGILCLYRFLQNKLEGDIMGQNFQTSDIKDICFHSVALGEGLKGFVYVSKRNVSHVFVSESLSAECTAKTLAHEIYHLRHDNMSHGIGLDLQLESSEQKANSFGRGNFLQLIKLMTS